MEEKTLKLNIPLLLPGIENESDRCLDRLVNTLQGRPGIFRAHLERERHGLCLHFDADQLSPAQVSQLAKRAGENILSRYHHQRVSLEGLDCSDCARLVEHSLGHMEGVQTVQVDYATGALQVEYDSQRTNSRAIRRRVEQLGYRFAGQGLRQRLEANRELLFSLLSGVLLLAGWLVGLALGLPQLSLALYLAAYVFGGYDITRHALHALSQRHFDTDALMILAALGAAVLGDFAEGALLLFLFSLGHAMEERALDRARNAIRALADLAPKTALVRRGEALAEIPVEQVALADIVVVRPGVRVPVDGQVVTGNSAVDQSPVTGESIPVEKTPGEQVFAGSVNGEGSLEVQATRLAKDSTLRRVMDMVERAQEQQSPTQQVTQRFMRYFVPAILILDALLIVVPPLFGVPWDVSFRRAMILLVATSPCALALGAPAAVLAGVAQAARNGVLVKGGAHLENLGRLRLLAFDKTGTLTQGRPALTDIAAYAGRSEDEVLALAAAVEGQSAHPLAQAILQEAVNRHLPLPTAEAVQSETGRGVRARVDGSQVWVGSRTAYEQDGIQLSEDARAHMETLESQGKTVVLVSQDGAFVGLMAVADSIRPAAPAALASLKMLGVSPVMLSGDTPRVAAHIAGQLGIREWRAGLLPGDKLEAIDELARKAGVVGMVGDGVNDAPALAQATVGIAMGGSATDVALETADVALMASDLSRLPYAVGLGRAAHRVILQNLVIALGVIIVLAALALTGRTGVGPVVVFHEGSTLLVVFNALRLLGYRQPAP